MANQTIFNSISPNNFRITRGYTIIGLLDPNTLAVTSVLKSMGSTKLTLDPKAETLDLRSNETPGRPRVGKPVVQYDMDLKLEIQQFTAESMHMITASTPNVVSTQVAATAQTTTVAGVVAGQVISLVMPTTGDFAYNSTVASIVDNATTPNNYVNGVNYFFDSATGLVQIVSLVDPTKMNLTINWSATAASPTAPAPIFNYFSNPEQKASLLVRQNNRIGANMFCYFPLVQIAPPSSIMLIQGDNAVQTAELELTVLWDTRHPGRELGWQTYLGPAGT